MTLQNKKPDPTEAPAGYHAVLKSSVNTSKLGNICRACDWRKTCQNQETNFTLHNHRCMDYGVISAKDGVLTQRHDGCSVVFKRSTPIVGATQQAVSAAT